MSKLDYSKVIVVGTKYATRNKDGSFKLFNTALEAAGGKAPEKKPAKK